MRRPDRRLSTAPATSALSATETRPPDACAWSATTQPAPSFAPATLLFFISCLIALVNFFTCCSDAGPAAPRVSGSERIRALAAVWPVLLIVCLVIGGGNIFRGVSGAATGMERATAGAFVDVVIAAGVALTLTSLLDLDVPGRLVLLGLLGGAGADTALRYRVLSRREA